MSRSDKKVFADVAGDPEDAPDVAQEEVMEDDHDDVVEAVAEEAEPEPVAIAPFNQVDAPVQLNGPFTVAGGNVVDVGGDVIAICGFSHNRVSSGPAVAGAVATALNRMYRTGVTI